MKTVFFSPRGTTRAVTEGVAAAMGGGAKALDLLSAPLTADVVIGADETIVVGMPVYYGRIPALCRESLAHLRGQGGPAVALAVYGNRHYDDALLELTDLLEENGFCVVGAGAFLAQHSIFPTVAQGRPDEADRKAMADFGAECAALCGAFSPEHPGELCVNGSRPYKAPGAVPYKPQGDERCTACGACADICPTGSIDKKEPRVTRAESCISCGACIFACPTGARDYRGEAYDTARAGFERKCALRREAEVFYRA